jgi:hypothetical protein
LLQRLADSDADIAGFLLRITFLSTVISSRDGGVRQMRRCRVSISDDLRYLVTSCQFQTETSGYDDLPNTRA